MLTTDHPWTASATTEFALRLSGGGKDERLISIPLGKHSIGSGPRCSLRLQYSGIQPLECLIVRDETGLRVRRWSQDALVNGEPFEEANLMAGDVLSLGPVDLVVVMPHDEELAGALAETTTPRDEEERGEIIVDPWFDLDEIVRPSVVDPSVYESEGDLPSTYEIEPQSLQPTETDSAWDKVDTAEESQAGEPNATDDQVELERRVATSIARRRSRRVLAALRRQRIEYDELVARVSDLEQKIEQALTESELGVGESVDVPSEFDHEVATTTEQETHNYALEAQFNTVREQLSAREQELIQARYSIDALERQLIDSQHTMHAFADERVVWEEQFNQLESRLAEYVGRIQELERQLDQVRAERAGEVLSVPATAVDGTVESHASEPARNEIVAAEIASIETQPAEETARGAPSGDGINWEEIVRETAAEEIAPTAVETVVEAVEPESKFDSEETKTEEPVVEVDAALEHLRGLSIWRQESETPVEESAAGAAEATVDEAPSAPSRGPASFIDRYAHLFPADDAAPEPLAPAQPVTPVVETTSATHSDEESVEQYMAKLMERMRGTTASQPGADEPVADLTQSLDAAEDINAAVEVPPPNREPITDLEELRSKASTPERPGHMAAMRALANQTARHAIGIHTARTLRRSARTRLIIALLGASVGIYLLLDAPGWKSLQFVAGCAAAFAAIYWGKLTLGTVLKGIQVGAFEDVDEEVDPEKTLHPPLPIDVERPTASETSEANEPAAEERV